MSTDTIMLLDSIIIHIEYLLGRYFAAWMLHSCMSKADEPCYSEKNKKYLLMEVTKLVGFFFFSKQGERHPRNIQESFLAILWWKNIVSSAELHFWAWLTSFPWGEHSHRNSGNRGDVMFKEIKSQRSEQTGETELTLFSDQSQIIEETNII